MSQLGQSDSVDQPTGSADKSRQRRALAVKLLLVWLALNLAAWIAPDVYQSARTTLRGRELDRIASHYESRTLNLADGSQTPHRINYLIFRPPEHSSKPLPLVVFLHGAGGKGNHLRKHVRSLGLQWVDEDWQRRHPTYVAAPQCPPAMTWDSRQPFDMLNALELMIDEIQRSESVDARRIYLAGHSMGAYGCWSLGAHRPDRFAAMVPVAGGGDVTAAPRLVPVPIWAVHGDDDSVIPVSESEVMVAAVNRAGGTARITKLAGVGHGSWRFVRTHSSEYLEWMFQQVKDGGSDE